MATFLPVLFWGLAVLAALTGWGRLLATRQNTAADWLEAPAWGIALSSFVGSLMNLGGLATRVGVVVFILIGGALGGFSLLPALKKFSRPANWRRPRLDWKWLALLALPLAALVLRFGASVTIAAYFHTSSKSESIMLNPQDDAQSYLVSPERMLQTGSLGADPFNCRQMMSALGAQHFLNAMVLAVFAPENAHIIDGGVGLAAACLAAAGLGWRLRLGRTGAVLLMLLPLIYYPRFINISSSNTTLAVQIALCSALVQLFCPAANWRRWLPPAGLLLAAACSLKSTNIPIAGLLVAVAAGLGALSQKSWRPLGLGFLVGMTALVVMSPWMWWQYHSSGTPLYPVLGRGFHAEVFFPSAPAPFHGEVVDVLKSGLILPVALLAGLLLAWTVPAIRAAVDRSTANVTLAILIGWVIAWPLIAISTESSAVLRYVLAARITALIMVLACIWHTSQQLGALPRWRWLRSAGPWLFVVPLLGHWAELKLAYGQIVPEDLAVSISGRAYSWTALTTRVQSAQAAVPAAAKILVFTDAPFLFDFRGNSILVADCPGESSPPPGLPVRQGGEAVASYLLGQNIRYVIYAYKSQANFPRTLYSVYLDPAYGRLVNRIAALSFKFQDDLGELAQTRAHLYDDGAVYVLDLASRRPAPPGSK